MKLHLKSKIDDICFSCNQCKSEMIKKGNIWKIFLRKLLNYKQLTVYNVGKYDTLQCVPVGVIICIAVLPRSMAQGVTLWSIV